jgi:hypothetical protein
VSGESPSLNTAYDICTNAVYRIPGGSEDVMLDLSVRQLYKLFQAKTKLLEKTGGSAKI